MKQLDLRNSLEWWHLIQLVVTLKSKLGFSSCSIVVSPTLRINFPCDQLYRLSFFFRYRHLNTLFCAMPRYQLFNHFYYAPPPSTGPYKGINAFATVHFEVTLPKYHN